MNKCAVAASKPLKFHFARSVLINISTPENLSVLQKTNLIQASSFGANIARLDDIINCEELLHVSNVPFNNGFGKYLSELLTQYPGSESWVQLNVTRVLVQTPITKKL